MERGAISVQQNEHLSGLPLAELRWAGGIAAEASAREPEKSFQQRGRPMGKVRLGAKPIQSGSCQLGLFAKQIGGDAD